MRRSGMRFPERPLDRIFDSLFPNLLLGGPVRLWHFDHILDDADDIPVRASDLVPILARLRMSGVNEQTIQQPPTVYWKISPMTLTSSPAGSVVNSSGER